MMMFDPVTERRYRREQVARLLPTFRVLMLTGAATNLGFFGFDLARGVESIEIMAFSRFVVSAIMVGLWGLALKSGQGKRWPYLWRVAMAALAALIIIGIALSPAGHTEYAPASFLILMTATFLVVPSSRDVVVNLAIILATAIVGLPLAGAATLTLVATLFYAAVFCILFGIAHHMIDRNRRRIFQLERDLRSARKRSDTLLREVLPTRIACRLAAGETRIAERVEQVSVLFLDAVGYTRIASRADPEQLVEYLSEGIEILDTLVRRHNLEKVKTMGDGYMVAGGVEGAVDRAAAVVQFALDAHAALHARARARGIRFGLRIGIATGPVVAGVIGTRRPHYDMWGPTVNRASRLQASAQRDEILIDAATRAAIGTEFPAITKGVTMLEGIGAVDSWRVLTADALSTEPSLKRRVSAKEAA